MSANKTIRALREERDQLYAEIRRLQGLAGEKPSYHQMLREARLIQADRRLGTERTPQEPSTPGCKGWTCFHCAEHFTDTKAASIHFGTHEIQQPACLIDAAEYRSMEERVRECANEDSELHRQLRRQASNHKLELQRAEESGYAKGLADASAPVERDEQPPFARIVISKLFRFEECASDFESGGVDIGKEWLDLLTQLGLLERVQRSPGLWRISDQGESLLEHSQRVCRQAEHLGKAQAAPAASRGDV
ncbi:hypothetical protein [Pseudomonas guariconensis]|uniref:hypothetical protein n=1 Tax=Pseudomonas guariconensis TaxID=1288410 RepID=UPI003906AFCE